MGGWPWQGHQRAHLEEGPPPRTLIPTRQLGAGWVSECTGPDASGPQRPHQGACRAVPTTECREKEKAPSPGLPGWQLSEISHGTPESQLAPHKRPGPTSPLTRGRAGRGPPGPPTARPSGALSPGLPNPHGATHSGVFNIRPRPLRPQGLGRHPPSHLAGPSSVSGCVWFGMFKELVWRGGSVPGGSGAVPSLGAPRLLPPGSSSFLASIRACLVFQIQNV